MDDLAEAHQLYTDAMREHVRAQTALDNARQRPGKPKDNDTFARHARTAKMRYNVARVYYFALRDGDPVHVATAKSALHGDM